MAVTFKVPSSPQVHVYQCNEFLGADFTSDASTVDKTKSPYTVNMTRSVPGKVRKRMGYFRVGGYNAPIYGVHHLTTTDIWLIHAGDKLFNYTMPKGRKWEADDKEVTDHSNNNILLLTGDVNDTIVYEGMAENRSTSLELDQKLVIFDGKRALIFDGLQVQPLDESDGITIPTLRINEEPTGGGTDYEAINLLSSNWYEEFYVSPTATTHTPSSVKSFSMAFDIDDAEQVKAWKLTKEGDWVEVAVASVKDNKVTLSAAPGASPVQGQSNVRIMGYHEFSDYKDRINHCKFGILFGVNGANDRLFVSGNADDGENDDGTLYSYRNWDWFSDIYNPYYFADTSYGQMGSDSTPIVGYSIINNYLATFKGGNEQAQAVLIREGDMVSRDMDGDGTEESSDPAFKLINTLQGVGALSSYCFSYLETEPMFLTRLGIYAITAQDITGEKYSQNRSYYLDGQLLKEADLKNAFAYTFKDLYILCVNDHCYILDGLQPMRTDREKPYATRQYVGFYWEHVPATVMFEINDELYFGSSDGSIYKFYTEEHDPHSYVDDEIDADGEIKQVPISAVWETADLCDDLFYKNKTYRYLAVKCMPEIVSSILIEGQRRGIWEQIKEDRSSLKYFTFNYINFANFTFSTDTTAQISATKVRLKKLDHVRFRFSNDKLEEPFGINDFAVEYTQNGNHKG